MNIYHFKIIYFVSNTVINRNSILLSNAAFVLVTRNLITQSNGFDIDIPFMIWYIYGIYRRETVSAALVVVLTILQGSGDL